MRNKPMLAYPVSDKPINYDNKVFMQPKLDGVRCLIQYDKKTGVTAWSRTGKQWKNIEHITSSLEKWFKSNQTTVLDGELYNHDLRDDFETIISLVRRQKPDDIDVQESRDMVQFHCYDYIPGLALRKAKVYGRLVCTRKQIRYRMECSLQRS